MSKLKFRRVVVDLRKDRSAPQMSDLNLLPRNLPQRLRVLNPKQKERREV